MAVAKAPDFHSNHAGSAQRTLGSPLRCVEKADVRYGRWRGWLRDGSWGSGFACKPLVNVIPWAETCLWGSQTPFGFKEGAWSLQPLWKVCGRGMICHILG